MILLRGTRAALRGTLDSAEKDHDCERLPRVRPWRAQFPARVPRMDLDTVLRGQDGVFSRAQATACGISAKALRSRVARGAVVVVAPGVYRAASHRPTAWGRVVAAALWAGPGAVVDGPAAAFLHRMSVPSTAFPVVGVTVPAHARRTPPDRIRVRRRTLDAADRTERRGVAVTAPALTALETAVALTDGTTFLDRVLQRGLPFPELLAAFQRGVGTHGWARARELVVEAADRADSRAERRLVAHLRRAGLTGFVLGWPFGPWRVDVAFVPERLAVELDGWAFHSDPTRFRADRRKQNALVAAGWTVLRFTWQDVRDRPGDTVGRIRSALR